MLHEAGGPARDDIAWFGMNVSVKCGNNADLMRLGTDRAHHLIGRMVEKTRIEAGTPWLCSDIIINDRESKTILRPTRRQAPGLRFRGVTDDEPETARSAATLRL